MTRPAPDRRDEPISLETAARLAFPDGRVKASTLRRERAGVVELVLAAIRAMKGASHE